MKDSWEQHVISFGCMYCFVKLLKLPSTSTSNLINISTSTYPRVLFMSWPMVSIVWVNYNSMRVMSVVLRSLKSILELDYPEYEIVVVDNNSVDGSFDRIKEFTGSLDEASRSKVKLLKLTVNKGYAG